MSSAVVSSELPDKVDTEALRAVVDGRWAWVRADVRANSASAGCTRTRIGAPRSNGRTPPSWSGSWLPAARPGWASSRARRGGRHRRVGHSIQMLAYADLSLMVKAGVQWGLFGGAVQALGTEVHHRRYLPAIMSFELPGCFANDRDRARQ